MSKKPWALPSSSSIMEVKKKGRVYPSQCSSPSSIPASYKDPNSVFKLFPVAILTLVLALSPQDQEVLAYMITRSIISTSNPSSFNHSQPKNKCKKGKIPVFQCGCFDCYTRFWHRWDCSPNRDLIHQVIEAFEDHLMQNEVHKRQCKASSRKKDKVTLNICESNVVSVGNDASEILMVETDEGLAETENRGGACDEVTAAGNLETEVAAVTTAAAGVVSHHKGLARKVLPDVVGLINSRFWSLWGPSI